jgi:hypothetical protein
LIALAAAMLRGQSTNGPVYWSATPPDCSSLSGELPVGIANASGATIGYSCYVSGTFVWLAAGGGWGSSIRVAAPASGAIGADFSFYDTNGNNLTLDTTLGRGSSITSGDGVSFALSANQPAEVDLLGATSNAPTYNSALGGSAYAVFYCPDATTCGAVLPQLIYSALPAIPWSLSVPIAWDTQVWTQWSAEGIDDGGANLVSLAIYNEGTTATAYTVRVYDSTGTLAGMGTTPAIPPFQPLGNGYLGEGGTYGALLKTLIPTPLPSGVFKILIDGGSEYSAVAVLQFTGASATALQVAYDSAPSLSASAASAQRLNVRAARVGSRPKAVFRELSR